VNGHIKSALKFWRHLKLKPIVLLLGRCALVSHTDRSLPQTAAIPQDTAAHSAPCSTVYGLRHHQPSNQTVTHNLCPVPRYWTAVAAPSSWRLCPPKHTMHYATCQSGINTSLLLFVCLATGHSLFQTKSSFGERETDKYAPRKTPGKCLNYHPMLRPKITQERKYLVRHYLGRGTKKVEHFPHLMGTPVPRQI
jgi:hypothetical protein